MASLKALERPGSLGERTYLALRDHLLSGGFVGGEPMQEEALAARFGVSRTPVREALARLASEGLLESSGRSYLLPALSRQDIDDIYELRLLLEPEAIHQVTQRLNGRKQIKPIRDQLAAMVAAHAAGDVEAFSNANYRYRAAWLELIPNRRLLRAIEHYADHVRYLRVLTLGEVGTRVVVLKGLKRLAAAFAAGNPAEGAAAMREHLHEAKRILQQALHQTRKMGNGNGIRG
ncbi:MAG: GntR family transcriptional regulator [Xanthobacteraceae bacterium]